MTVRDLTILGCSAQQPTRLRNHGAYLLRISGEGLLFDPGEGTQRQFIFADIAPPTVNRIFVSHFHGDHCLGLGSMLMRLNLDKVEHPIHCYYPASGKVFFDRLRFSTAYHDHLNVIEHPVSKEGIVDITENLIISATFLDHGIDNLAWRIQEAPRVKFDKNKLQAFGIHGPLVKILHDQGYLEIAGKKILLNEVSWERQGDAFVVVIDTRMCDQAIAISQGAKVLLCESTYLEEHRDLAEKNHHLTALQAAEIAHAAQAEMLILTHFSARYKDLSLFEKEARAIFPNTVAADDLKQFSFPL